MHWQPARLVAGAAGQWAYAVKSWEDDGTRQPGSGEQRRCLRQRAAGGRQFLFHPDAYGHASSIEAGVSFDQGATGWAGVFVQAPNGPGAAAFTGNTFALNPGTNQLRLARLAGGAVVASKVLPYDFTVRAHRTYSLTLSSVAGVLRGYVDGHNLISMPATDDAASGYAGLLTEETAAYFDDVHFSALTPAAAQSRQVQTRFFANDAPSGSVRVQAKNLALCAFRWQKRYGLLPWQRTYQSPEPPGNLFGPTDSTARPNASQFWRSEDAANSALLAVDGRFYYFMRGNPDYDGPHGAAALGVLTAPDEAFDGRHFRDLSATAADLDHATLLRGHQDRNAECADGGPRSGRLQVNDEGAVYQNGKILVFAREFRNHIGRYPWFRRLIFGVFDLATQRWDQLEPHLVSWSQMNPDSCQARHWGLDATPDVVSLRDPLTDEYVIFLHHHSASPSPLPGGGLPPPVTSAVSGLRYDGQHVTLHPGYPGRATITKHSQGNSYGERIMFDNGIYYLNVNATSEKLVDDWPDRFELFATLDPYAGPWTGSADNTNPGRPYFARGGRCDPDNGAIWQGTMVKRRGWYYMYYENFHVLHDVNQPYELYDRTQSGSRVGFATAN